MTVDGYEALESPWEKERMASASNLRAAARLLLLLSAPAAGSRPAEASGLALTSTALAVQSPSSEAAASGAKDLRGGADSSKQAKPHRQLERPWCKGIPLSQGTRAPPQSAL